MEMKIFYKQKLLSVYFIRQLYRTRSIGLPGYLLTSGALTEEMKRRKTTMNLSFRLSAPPHPLLMPHTMNATSVISENTRKKPYRVRSDLFHFLTIPYRKPAASLADLASLSLDFALCVWLCRTDDTRHDMHSCFVLGMTQVRSRDWRLRYFVNF
jgi:hypothetical protein